MKKLLIAVIVIVIAGIGLYFWVNKDSDLKEENVPEDITQEENIQEETQVEEDETESVVGKSVEGRDIMAYHYGTGKDEILFVAGIHGGYAWNTAFLAYEIMDYLEVNALPENIKVTVIPVLNPDGLNKAVGTAGRFNQSDVSSSQDVKISSRFNANFVDINRNFDCNWQKAGVWQSMVVSGGSEPFSEPESKAVRNYVQNNKLAAVVAWYSAAGGVFSSSCENGIMLETQAINDVFADASGYLAYEDFDFYELSGDMTNWFAKNNIPAISILLTDHENIEWDKNIAGIEALLGYYTK